MVHPYFAHDRHIFSSFCHVRACCNRNRFFCLYDCRAKQSRLFQIQLQIAQALRQLPVEERPQVAGSHLQNPLALTPSNATSDVTVGSGVTELWEGSRISSQILAASCESSVTHPVLFYSDSTLFCTCRRTAEPVGRLLVRTRPLSPLLQPSTQPAASASRQRPRLATNRPQALQAATNTYVYVHAHAR